jgi:DNA processing protein
MIAMNDDERSQWLRLSLIPSIPLSLCALLLEACGSASAIGKLSLSRMLAIGIKPSAARAILTAFNRPDDDLKRAIDEAIDWAERDCNEIITLADANYPPLLKEIPDPPLVLYASGQLLAMLSPQIAIVGSRACSADGKRNARWIASELAALGFGITSGLAHGIDTCAHAAALAVNGTSVAVMATGADTVYPKINTELAHDLKARGTLLTEMPLGSKPLPSHFPRRNRIISGMSLALVVVEAAPKSGSLISARLAMEQGREVFAIPGSIRNPMSKGCHQLIRDGAQLLDSVEQITAVLAPIIETQVLALASASANPEGQTPRVKSEEERAVLQAIGYDPMSVDYLVFSTGISVATLQGLLLSLELQGRIRCIGGAYALV